MYELYESRNSKYCYENTNILINKLDIKNIDQLLKYEAQITAAKLLDLRHKKITGNFDLEHITQIHKYLFEDIYPFAGLFRTENIAKGNFRFAEWEFIEEQLKILLNHLKEQNYLENNDKNKLAENLAYYMAELNVLHPFRDRKCKNNKRIYKTISIKKWI